MWQWIMDPLAGPLTVLLTDHEREAYTELGAYAFENIFVRGGKHSR